MPKFAHLLLAFTLAVGVGSPAQAATVTIRLATFTPANSAWHKALLEMGATWSADTAGRVKLIVYPGGQQGSEATVVKLMRADELQAALLLVPGLSKIDEGANVTALPFFLDSDEESAHVFSKVRPLIDQRLAAQGFHAIQWGFAGWTRVFSKQPIRSMKDLQAAKLYTTAGEDRMVQWYADNGFHPVALNFSDIPAQLKLRTGLIDAVPSPPLGALLLQFFRDAPYMLAPRVGALAGATVISDKAWNAIEPADREKMLVAAKAMETKLLGDVAKIDNDAITAMTARGLTVIDLPPAERAALGAAGDKFVQKMRGVMIPADVFDVAVAARDAFRQAAKAGTPAPKSR
jgi:TRAP-type C4-dicarboxylate transport system substrate-binding protein